MATKVVDVQIEINKCLEIKENFLLSGGAGSGKTHTLVETLKSVFAKNQNAKVACITYTNVAADEIKSRAPFDNLRVSTIHDFLWSEIKNYQKNLCDAFRELNEISSETEEVTNVTSFRLLLEFIFQCRRNSGKSSSQNL